LRDKGRLSKFAIMTTLHRLESAVEIFAEGDTCCAVCAVSTIGPVEIERQITRKEPWGSILAWKVFPGRIGNRGNPAPCPHHAGRRHWLLVRELKR
jgi:hypothetical protein